MDLDNELKMLYHATRNTSMKIVQSYYNRIADFGNETIK